MLWMDTDKKKSLAQVVAEAAAYYESKYGDKPNLVHVNRLALDGSESEIIIRVVKSKLIMKGHYWIGIDGNDEPLVKRE